MLFIYKNIGRNNLYDTGQLQNCKLCLGINEGFSLPCRKEGETLALGAERIMGAAFKVGLIFAVPKAHSLHSVSQARGGTLAVLSTT